MTKKKNKKKKRKGKESDILTLLLLLKTPFYDQHLNSPQLQIYFGILRLAKIDLPLTPP
jgi:hypothetical protein